MKKETEKIATNASSGAEKVENIQKTAKQKTSVGKTAAKTVRTQTKTVKKNTAPKSAKGDAALGDSAKSNEKEINVKKQNAQSTNGKAEAESAAAKARVEAALKKKEEKAKRKAERLEKAKAKKAARKQKSAQERTERAKKKQAKKELIAKRNAEKRAKAEKRVAEKHARAEARRNKKKANKKISSKRHDRKERNANKNNGQKEKGYGGWIAAVVTLGVTTLVLATTSTVGMIEAKRAEDSMISSYRGTMYEMTGLLENVEKDLDRVRISDSSAQQSRILTDLLVQTRLAELDIEKLPISAEEDRNITAFVNNVGRVCENILGKLRHGEPLSQEDRAVLEQLYQINHGLKEEVATLMEKATDKDFMEYAKKGKGMFSDSLGQMEKLTLMENNPTFHKKNSPDDGEKMPAPKTEDETPRIEGVKAEELCAKYFQSYDVGKYQCVGETIGKGYTAYNVQGYDEKGLMLFAEIDQKSGELIRFDYYEECSGDTFDLQNAERIAEEFLQGLGYENMEVIRSRGNGSTTDFTFVYEQEGIAYYPDEIHVRVCRTRGLVSGMDASKYLQNHRGRGEVNTKITLAQAYEKLYKELSVEASRLVVVKTARGEKAAYEMLCSYGEDRYLVYVDAANGDELSIVNVKDVQF